MGWFGKCNLLFIFLDTTWISHRISVLEGVPSQSWELDKLIQTNAGLSDEESMHPYPWWTLSVRKDVCCHEKLGPSSHPSSQTEAFLHEFVEHVFSAVALEMMPMLSLVHWLVSASTRLWFSQKMSVSNLWYFLVSCPLKNQLDNVLETFCTCDFIENLKLSYNT